MHIWFTSRTGYGSKWISGVRLFSGLATNANSRAMPSQFSRRLRSLISALPHNRAKSALPFLAARLSATEVTRLSDTFVGRD
jgi:hypothetical protein